ncbi:hypothetical protein OV450_0052 [Actinobacteria bacterium OV450]|nr:hypothetical protein OV450_0052 [Actinobacteria bacterium OV450]
MAAAVHATVAHRRDAFTGPAPRCLICPGSPISSVHHPRPRTVGRVGREASTTAPFGLAAWPEIRDLGAIPAHIKQVVGWEAIAWHTPEWWRFQWGVTELVDVKSARLQKDAWRDWLLWARACAEQGPDGRGPISR